jgi:hypothetical protein
MSATDTPPPPSIYSADELTRMRNETRALLTVAMKDAAARVTALMQPPAPDERLALLERIKQDLAAARAGYESRGARAMREDARFACDALGLFRICRRARCRKAQACRGDPSGCYARASVPEPVMDFVGALLLAERMPWLPLIAAGRAAERTAYECWIAGLEAGGRKPCSRHARA